MGYVIHLQGSNNCDRLRTPQAVRSKSTGIECKRGLYMRHTGKPRKSAAARKAAAYRYHNDTTNSKIRGRDRKGKGRTYLAWPPSSIL